MRDAALRARAFRQLLASMSPAAIAQLMQTLNRYGEDQEQEDQAGGLIALMAAQQLVIEHAALTDPAAVLTALSSAGPAMRNSEFYQDVLRGWAERDPAAACRFFEQNTLHDATVDAKAVAGALVRELVKTDPEGTFRWLRGLKADFVDAVAHDALQTLSHYDGVTAGRLLVENSDLNKAPELAAAMTEGWARTEPDKALAWALTLPSNISGEGVKTASGVWAAKDYAGAMAAVAALEGGPRAAALSGIAAATGAQHWQELMPMMASLPESADRAAAVGSLIGYWVDKAPDAASRPGSGTVTRPGNHRARVENDGPGSGVGIGVGGHGECAGPAEPGGRWFARCLAQKRPQSRTDMGPAVHPAIRGGPLPIVRKNRALGSQFQILLVIDLAHY